MEKNNINQALKESRALIEAIKSGVASTFMKDAATEAEQHGKIHSDRQAIAALTSVCDTLLKVIRIIGADIYELTGRQDDEEAKRIETGASKKSNGRGRPPTEPKEPPPQDANAEVKPNKGNSHVENPGT